MAVVFEPTAVGPEQRDTRPGQGWERRMDNGPLARLLLTFGVLGPIAALIVAIIQLWQRTISPKDVVLLIVMYSFIAMGVTVGYHRYLTHRGFRAPGWLKFFLLALGSMAVEGPALVWASTHLEHHAKSDREGDPHSPLQGFVHAHLGWIIDGFDANPQKYSSWLRQDPIVKLVDRTFWFWVLLSLAIPFAVDGWRGLIWGGFVRMLLVHHVTWSVNSVCHVFGKRPFKTGDRSTNHWLVGLLAGGEGWHNNHHAFQRSAFHGLFWWQFDFSGLIIRSLELLHVIADVQRVDPTLIAKRLREARGGA
ncbi:MAG: acyl-CoA desaturase [Chloroflexi bacterium]|nr:acyl-CoA desaturase [Chloroflexota bacterium]